MKHIPRKRFGQHFLSDPGIIDAIVRAIAPRPGQHMVEIGPGLAALTQPLVERLGRLTVIELDRDLAARLRQHGQLDVIESDVLKVDFTQVAQTLAAPKIRVVGNLPYNISTPLIFHLLEHAGIIQDMHFMLQKEVVERLAAEPGGGDWGRLSIMVQYFCKVDYLFTVGPGAFNPPPKVESAIVRLAPYAEPPHPAKDHRLLERIVREAFNQRRKTLRNTLRSLMSIEDIEAAGVDPSLRPEQLDVADFVRLANRLAELAPEQ